ncbi:ubiquitin-like protein Pup [Saccharopolyspora taberi]|uniref:Prokaryotic ubiquitin-like protein Pup n=1 Tax=Saccharopolyspora taberi TaxID=60895 RepID=A0ABN3VEQ7_9PSEU
MRQDRNHRPSDHDDDDVPEPSASGQERREKLDSETEDVLDEIDDVLEDNPQDFVRSYVQKGGQ